MSMTAKKIIPRISLYFAFLISGALVTGGNVLAVGVGMLLFNVVGSGLFVSIVDRRDDISRYSSLYSIFTSLVTLCFIWYGAFLYRLYMTFEELLLVYLSSVFGVVIVSFLSRITFAYYAEKYVSGKLGQSGETGSDNN